MSRRFLKWIPTLLFWTLFATSIGLGEHYRWLDTLWYAAGMLSILALSIYSLTYAIRYSHEKGAFSVKGIPRWLERFALDEDSIGSGTKVKPR